MRFSIIVPVYKTEKYLEQCVASILSQEYTDFELILVDDGSPDNCPKICDEYAKVDERIRVIHKTNGGLSSARNEGIKNAKGDYLIFIDSDDYVNNEKILGKFNDVISQEPVDVITCRFVKLYEDSGKIVEDIGYDLAEEHTAKTLIESRSFVCSACSKAIKRELIVDNGIWFEEGVFSEDVVWCSRLLEAADTIKVLTEKFYVYRQRQKSITHDISSKNVSDMQKHIDFIIAMKTEVAEEKKEILNRYLAEILCNFVILLSRFNYSKEDIRWVFERRKHIKYATLKRSKIIKLFIKLFGVSISIKLLKMVGR